MNKKITVQRNDGKVRYCVLDGEKDIRAQLNLWYYGAEHPDGGYSIDFSPDKIKIIDYFAYDTVACFDVLSIEDTDFEVTTAWVDPETGRTGWN